MIRLDLRKVPVFHLSKEVAEKGKFLGLFNPKSIYPHARYGCDAFALIKYKNKFGLYMVSLKRAKEIWGAFKIRD